VFICGSDAHSFRRSKTLDHTVIDRSEEIAADAQALRLLSIKVPVVTFVNKHFAGYAHDTITSLNKALKEQEAVSGVPW